MVAMFSSNDEMDPMELFCALGRRWVWILGGLLMGLSLTAGLEFAEPKPEAQARIKLIVNPGLGPCRSNLISGECSHPNTNVVRAQLDVLAAKKSYEYSIENYKSGDNSESIEMQAIGPLASENRLEDIMLDFANEFRKQTFNNNNFSNSQGSGYEGWINISTPSVIKTANRRKGNLEAGLFAGLMLGTGAALLADRRANRVFNQSEILKLLGYPLRLSLPSLPWLGSEINPLIFQFYSQLNQSLDWHLLSIVDNHEAVNLLVQALKDRDRPGLVCTATEPLLSSVLEFNPSGRDKGILLVVESGFNSAKGLGEARRLLDQMIYVKEVGVVLVGVPLPPELTKPRSV